MLKIKATKYAKKSPRKMHLCIERLESKDVAAEYVVHTENQSYLDATRVGRHGYVT